MRSFQVKRSTCRRRTRRAGALFFGLNLSPIVVLLALQSILREAAWMRGQPRTSRTLMPHAGAPSECR